jgi:hypothetical protein
MMHFTLDQAIAILSRTPFTLKSMLTELPSEWIVSNEGDQTWSPFDVVGHLIHGEQTDWLPRLKIILEFGEARAFEPFDRFAQMEVSKGRTVTELLDTFEGLRSDNIRELRELKLDAEDLRKTGKHPELGTVTLEELIATWVVHDLDHIVQITRTLAKQYEGAVGPWKAYLKVLK